jgi:hypothetical protein
MHVLDTMSRGVGHAPDLRACNHAPKLVSGSNSASFLLADGERHGCGVAVRLCVHKASDLVGGGGNFPAHVGQLVVAATQRE